MDTQENSDTRPLQDCDEDFGKSQEQKDREKQREKSKSGFDWKMIAQEEDPYGEH